MSYISENQLDRINFNLDDYTELFEAYTKDLEEYIAAFSGRRDGNVDYAKRFLLSKLEEKWLPILNFNSSRILSDIRDLQAPRHDYVTSLSLRELLKYEDGESDWLIPNFFSSTGLYILAAPPKTGKTILLNKLMYAVAVSGVFMDRPTQTGNVLYIQLEESIKTMKKRAYLSGFGDDSDEETSLVVNFSDRLHIERVFDLSTDLDWLSKLIMEYKPKLVAIDSLRMASVKSDAGENTNEFGKLLYALQQVVNFSGTCCVLVHHMNKTSGGKNIDLVQKLAGHTSISAASDGIIGLTSEEDEDGRMIMLKTKPRDGTEMTIYYRLVKNDKGLWDIKKIFEDTPGNSVYTSLIMRFLGKFPDEYFTATAIAKELGIEISDKDFNASLEYLDSSEILSKKFIRQSVRYALTTNSLWIVNPSRVKDMVSPSIIDANNIMLCKTKKELRELVKDWDSEREKDAKLLLFPEERDRVKNLIRSWEFDIDEHVIYKNVQYIVVERYNMEPSLSKNKYKLGGVKEWVLEAELSSVDIDYDYVEPVTIPEIKEEDLITDEFQT